MGSVNFSKSRRRSRIVELCIRRWYRRQSPGGAQLSPSVSGDAEECRMGLRRSRRDGPYDIVNNLPTAGLVLAMRQRQRIPDKKSEAPLSVRNPERYKPFLERIGFGTCDRRQRSRSVRWLDSLHV